MQVRLTNIIERDAVTLSGGIIIQREPEPEQPEVISDFEVLGVAQNSIDGGNLKGDKTRDAEKIFNEFNVTVYFRFKQSVAIGATTDQLIGLGGQFTNARGMAFYYTGGNLNVYASDGSNNVSGTLVVDADTNIFPLDYVDVLIVKDRKAKTLTVGLYNPSGDIVGSELEFDIATFAINDDENFTYFYVQSTKNSIVNLLVTSDIRTLAECTNIDSIVGIMLYYPSLVTGIDVSGDELHLGMTNIASNNKTAYVKSQDYMREYGYVVYKRSTAGYEEFHFPIGMDDLEISPANLLAVSSNYTRIVRIEPNSNHTLYDCKIRFSNAIFDRSDTNIWNADCQASFYYDANDPFAFHISEMNQRTFYEYLNDGYRGRIFIKGTSHDYLGSRGGSIEHYYRASIDSVSVYATDKKGGDNYEELQKTGDYFAVAKENDGSVTMDAEGYPTIGYFQMTKPFFAIRFDDGFESQVNAWKDYLDSRSMVAFITVLTGTGDVGNWWYENANNGILFTDLDRVAADGWEITAHGVDNTDLTYKSQKNQDADISYSIAKLKALGHNIIHYTPHGYAGADLHVRYMAMQQCFSHHVGYTIAHEGANPKILLLDNLSNVRGDISGDFNLDDPAGVQKCKDEIDVAMGDNRLFMIFIHEWAQNIEDGLEEVLDYIDAQGMESGTLSDALIDNARYLPKP